MAHQDRIAKRHYGIATLFGVIVLAMGYVMYQAFTTPGVGLPGLLLPAAMACFAAWRMERSVHRGRQGNLLLLRLLDALDGQPYSYDAATALIEGMKAADSTDPAKYLPAMQKVNFKGVSGNIAFDAKGDIKDGAVTVYQFKAGKWEPVQ